MKYTIFLVFVFISFFVEAQPLQFAYFNIANNNADVSNGLKSFNNTVSSSDTIISYKTSSVKPFNDRVPAKSLVLPATLVSYGILALNNNSVRSIDVTTSKTIKDANKNFSSSLDNYTQYGPALAVYGLNAIGVKGKNSFLDRSLIYGISTIVTGAVVCTIKSMSKVARPDGSATNSFPSGHTTTAFAAAEFLHQEYKHRSPIYSILGYAAATTTGVLRMYNNRHYLSDVIAGAGFGILSTKLVYWAYPVVRRKIVGRKRRLVAKQVVSP